MYSVAEDCSVIVQALLRREKKQRKEKQLLLLLFVGEQGEGISVPEWWIFCQDATESGDLCGTCIGCLMRKVYRASVIG
jgi:hypothetical protein